MKVKTIVLLGLSVLAFSACGSQPVVSEPQTSLSECQYVPELFLSSGTNR